MHRQYNVAMVCACPFPSSQGSQVFIKQLSESLINRGHNIHLVTYHFGEQLKNTDLTVHRIPNVIFYRKFRAGPSLTKPFLDILLSLKLFQVVRSYKIDIIHAHNYEASLSGFIVGHLMRIPVIFHTHGIMEDELYTYFQNKFFQFLAKKSACMLDEIVPLWADHIIAISPEVKSFFLAKGIPEQKIDYISPGISCSIISEDSGKIRDIYAIGKCRMVLYTGNLDRYQNLQLLFESFRLVLQESPETLLVIVTHCDFEKYADLCKQIGISPKVLFIKNLSFAQIQLFLKEAQVVVLPRISWSGFPIKLLNYMAAGKPIVVSKGSAKEIEHLKDGIVVEDGDVFKFAQAITTLLGDPKLCQRLGENAKKKAERLFAWDSIIVEIEKVYAKIWYSYSRNKRNKSFI
jgi:glycosyltransferase involved in cell wall biosynthesis